MQIGASLCVLAALVAAAWGSSHSEAPGIAKNPSADNTDFYMFRSYEPGRKDYLTFIMNVHGLQDPYGGPNYFALSDDHFFQIKIDNDGDAEEDISIQFYAGNRLGGDPYYVPFEKDLDDCVYEEPPGLEQKHGGLSVPVLHADGSVVQEQTVPLKFIGPIRAGADNEPYLNWYEWYQINWTLTDAGTSQVSQHGVTEKNYMFKKPFDYAGQKSFGTASEYETYANEHIYEIDIPNCPMPGRVFVGQRKEGFYLNLGGIFDLINFVPIPGFPGAITEDKCHNDLRYSNVDSFVIEVPIQCVTNGDSDVIGAWTTVNRLCHDGEDHVVGDQVSRLGNPLVNELVIAIANKSAFNQGKPKDDGQFLNFVQFPSFPSIVDILFRDAVNGFYNTDLPNIAPEVPRTDLVSVFLTGIDGINQPHPVTPSEMLRLNVGIEPTPKNKQNNFGVIDGDLAGFPNGRRPGDDTVDIVLRVAMGRLCYIGLCTRSADYAVVDAPVGMVNFTDGAPVTADDFDDHFPYLRTPEVGSPWAGRKCSDAVKNPPPLGNCGLGSGSYKSHPSHSAKVRGCPNGALEKPLSREALAQIRTLLSDQERVVRTMQKSPKFRSAASSFDTAYKYNQRLVNNNFVSNEEPIELYVEMVDDEEFDRLKGIFERANAGIEFFAYTRFGYDFDTVDGAPLIVSVDEMDALSNSREILVSPF